MHLLADGLDFLLRARHSAEGFRCSICTPMTPMTAFSCMSTHLVPQPRRWPTCSAYRIRSPSFK